MFGGLGNLTEMLKTAREMKSRMAEIQESMAAKRYTSEAGGGVVAATVDGKGALMQIKIKPDATADIELLEDLITAAVNAAVAKSQAEMKQEMSKLTGGMQIPGLDSLLGGAE